MLSARAPTGISFNARSIRRRAFAKPDSTPDDDGVGVRTSMSELLVADDEPGIRRLLKQMLSPLGCVIREAVDGDDAVEQFLAAPHRFRAVILDVRMPHRSGVEVMQTVHAIRPECPVFLITGSPERVPEKFLTSHVKLILKPFRAAELLEAIGPQLKLRAPALGTEH